MAGPTTAVKTTCPYCGVGCGVIARVGRDGAVAIKGDPDHPANFGRLCSKGSALGETLSLTDRLLYPEVSGERKSWDEALNSLASAFTKTIERHGPGSVAIYASGQLLTEDYYVANKLMKGFIGSANIDTNSRLCMASSVAGHKRAFGADAVPGCYEDFDEADLVVLVGSNLAWCHPVLYQRLVAAKQARPHMRIVLLDPRRTMTEDLADLHLALDADSDVALFTGLLAEIARRGALDESYVARHTTGIDAALASAMRWPLKRVAEAANVSLEAIQLFFDWFVATEKTLTIYSQGVNQSASGTDKVNAIINCHLATGRIGKPGAGPFSVTGQPNAMGGREVGGLANMLAAHMDFSIPEDIGRVRRFWKASNIATFPGLRAVELFKAMETGAIKAVWIMATNPVDSLPEADRFRRALQKCDFVAVSDMSANTDTMAWAHVRLPAVGWGEKDGTVTNSERRISRQRSFLDPPGEARPDWWIICEVAKRMGFGSAFTFESASEIFAEHAGLSSFENNGTRDFDLTGLTGLARHEYDTLQPVQWPVITSPTKRLFSDGDFFTKNGRARFVALVPPPPKTPAPGHFTLNTGRVRDHWHTMTRTGKAERLSAHYAEPFAEIHPKDAKALGIEPASLMHLENAHGSAIVRALISDRQKPGNIFVPMHWTDQFSARARVNALVTAQVDPHSGQPALKMSDVLARPAQIAWHGFVICKKRPDLSGLDYWALAEADGGVRIEVAHSRRPADWEAFARQSFGLDETAQILSVSDDRSQRCNLAAFKDGALVFALFAAPEPVSVSRQWMVSRLSQSTEPMARATILAGRPGADVADTGAIVCACFQVGVNTIADAVTRGLCMSVEEVGEALNAGTNCGSCRAEIRGIVDAHRLQAAG